MVFLFTRKYKCFRVAEDSCAVSDQTTKTPTHLRRLGPRESAGPMCVFGPEWKA